MSGNLEALVSRYKEDTRTKKINEFLQKDTPSRIRLEGLVGAQESFVLSAIYLLSPRVYIYIAIDKEEAAYLQNTLEAIHDASDVMFFPDSFKRPMQFEEMNNSNILQRTEVVNKLRIKSSKPRIVVSYPEALFEKVVNPAILEANKIVITKDEKLDVDTMIEILVDYGFIRTDFVYEPGQFSIRGGIIDIFSYGNEWPYRIELFDDEVESIRTFNPINQLSVQNIATVSIIPNINIKFKQNQKVPLFDVLDANSVVWVKDFDVLLDKLQICFDKCEEFAKVLKTREDSELKQAFEERAFIYPNETMAAISDHHMILERRGTISIDPDLVMNYETSNQSSFNKNFSLLIEDMKHKEKQGFTNYLFTDSSRQIERFYKIFEDLDAQLDFHPVNKAIHAGFVDRQLNIACYTDHQIFERFHKYKLKKGFTKEQAMSLKMLRELQPGDFVTHIDHGVGRYSGLEKIEINGHKQESLRLFYQNNDVLYVSINSLHKISKFKGKDGTPPKLSKIGGDAWKKLKSTTKRKVKDMAKELIKLYAKRKASKGHAFPPDGYLQNELEASFIYQDTPDQEKATIETKQDMMQEHPMDRLICGDVGFGKTEIAIRAAFKCVSDGKQVAILVPTTILALQHYKTFSERLKEFGVTIDYVNRFRTAKEKTQIYKDVESGRVEILIGTHAILNKKIKFKDLGLLVIDEEQKFGVAAKEKLRGMKVNVDTLTLTATPIPRTLQFSLMAARDLSIIRTPPPNRQSIHTERRIFNDELIKDSIYYEVNRGGQVFFVHNRVKSLPEIAGMIQKLCPDIKVGMAHGQLEAKQLEKKLIDFIDYKYDVLVCTNIIETGLDIANANTIIINNAQNFGMSDLHQLRGRVGRSNRKAFCYLFTPPISVLTSEARKRIRTLEENSELGSGFQIAMKDLDIRGAGNLLGGEQSGFISDIGFETYQKILEEAVHELKETEFKDLFKEDLDKKREYVRDVEIDTDIEMLIPDAYIPVIQERLLLYTELDTISDEAGLSSFKIKLKDRFGTIPKQVDELVDALRLRWICKELGFERLSYKNNKLRCFFIANAQSSYFESELFQKLLKFVSTDGQKMGLTLKQSKNFLIVIKERCKNLREVKAILDRMGEEVL
ncbi:transcription-repair coupling factor [Saprospiraceae bacterium]|nr:transcription-repair coupling factor [Saprospiraceae bacterium]MDB9914375.1 transcription-repair coupling factor [Saprospiraceae bacterium]MDC1305514.1 transcription-repair coupling factor [Saprospiraceae bacterium]